MTTIGKYAFEGCERLAVIKIGTGLGSIHSTGLLSNASITEVHCYAANPPAATDDDFDVKSSTTLYVPKGSRNLYVQSAWGRAFTNIIEMKE